MSAPLYIYDSREEAPYLADGRESNSKSDGKWWTGDCTCYFCKLEMVCVIPLAKNEPDYPQEAFLCGACGKKGVGADVFIFEKLQMRH